jgi:CspA family cold shock protein
MEPLGTRQPAGRPARLSLLELILGVGVSHALSFFFPYFMETKRNPCAFRFPSFALSDTAKLAMGRRSPACGAGARSEWFNSQKGYGFIQPQGGGKDVFVHISAVEKAGLSSLNEGQVVEYEEVANKGKTSAENLKVQR